MAWRRGQRVARFSFTLGEAFPADDRMATYVMRLSMALGDLRTVAEYATRKWQREGERLYFIRLFTLHMREIVNLLDPPDPKFVPTVHEFVASLPRGIRPTRSEIRDQHAKVLRRLSQPMNGREPITVRGKRRIPTLRDDLRRIRNDFAHYGHNAVGADAVARAMRAASEIRTGYMIRERALRAEYADTVAMTLTHPFALDDRTLAEDLHGRIVDLVGPVSSYIHNVEAAWLRSRPSGVTTLKQY
jgi:hypothetical protein